MILIRCDANEHIGTGHVMRCFSLAKALKKAGEEILFVTADEKVHDLIWYARFRAVSLGTDWTDLEGELPALKKLLEQYKPSLLLIDSYYASRSYFRGLSGLVRTAYIDDLNAAIYDTDVLINYNIYAGATDYSPYMLTDTKLLLGPSYAPLREEFETCPVHEIRDVREVMVSVGGADPAHMTAKLLKSICPDHPEITFHFVIGALNPIRDENKVFVPDNAVLHVRENHMSDLMKQCDIAVSAAGTTLYELCACGIPTITFTLADNQLQAAEQFAFQKIMISAGDCRDDDGFPGRLDKHLTKLIRDEALRRTLSERMQALVDGHGAQRLAEELLK